MVPAIAVADALRAEGAEVSFVGGQRAEAELVPAAGYPLDPIRVEGISRSNPLKAARAVGKAALALKDARAILRRREADGVLGGGGYVAGPVGAAAVALRIPLVLTEADSHLGLSNRLLAARAARVCLAFPLPGREGERYVVTGRPVPPRVAERDEARSALGIDPATRCVLVFGGSLGARSVNHAAVAAFRDAPYRVLHIAGRRDFPDLAAPGAHYDLRDYLVPFGQALAAADLAVARAGGSIFELAQYGLPGRPDPVSARHRRPSDRQRALDGAGRRGDRHRRRRAHARGAQGGGRRDPARRRAAAPDGRRGHAARPPGRRPRTSPASCSRRRADPSPRVATPFVQSGAEGSSSGTDAPFTSPELMHGRLALSDNRGFTMVELLVVILIIAILAMIALPAFTGQRTKAQDLDAQTTLRTAATALATYHTDHDSFDATEAQLRAIEPALGQASAGFAVSGTRRHLRDDRDVGLRHRLHAAAHRSDGQTERTCTVPGRGRCDGSGGW